MTHDEFINETIKMIKQCECNDFQNDVVGFKLKMQKNDIRSLTITAQVLLIFQQLFGNNFMFNNKISNTFEFDKIIKYLNNIKGNFLKIKKEDYSQIIVCRCAYCGIALLLLKQEKAANSIADLLCDNRINNEYAWGLRLTDDTPDVLSTYIVTMLLNRLHRNFSRPNFLENLLEQCDENGIPYRLDYPQHKYIEALTIVLYMDKFYYNKSIEEDKIQLVNIYYYNGIDSICEAKEIYFKEHPKNYWRIYAFGLASNITAVLNNPFYEYVLEKLTKYFDKPETNIPYVLEICRMYNAINRNNDPFRQDHILSEINLLKNKICSLEEKIYHLNEYNREITIKIPIATAFVALYFVVFGFLVYMFLKRFVIKVFKVKDFNDICIVIDLGISVIILTIVFLIKKVRKILINLVDKFYKKFNVVRTTDE